MNKKWLIFWALSMVLGFVVWHLFDDSYVDQKLGLTEDFVWSENLEDIPLVAVGEYQITLGDIDFEHKLLTEVLSQDSHLLEDSHQEAEDSRIKASWHSLRQFLLQTLIKRKALFTMIKRDKTYDLKDPQIYQECYQKFREVLADEPEFFSNKAYRHKLETRICEGLVIERYVTHLTEHVQVTEQMAKDYYLAHRSEFSSPERMVIRHIQLPSEEVAREVHRKARRRNFAQLAKDHSIAPEAASGGLLGPFAAHEMPSFLAEVFLLKLSRISPILKSSYGYHIVMPLKKLPSKIQEFEEVRERIMADLIEEETKKIYAAWVHRTLNTVSIVTEPYLLKGGSI